MSGITPCIWLDYSDKYKDAADLAATTYDGVIVRFWVRKTHFDERRSRCQFCGLGRGRINSVLDCYQEGFQSCYQPHGEDA